ncbi:hypothetical protein UFOVP159_30 [uncultured Caudovirales phage]|uniref:Uncharacterized protein n=1 Tax=uncultured Caudovirales phage TaxID=2100421 RepID=A0A6J7WH72_9CAUD|nr:hypothetical protein UFOVP159_30 [uncultured Caudovirales phage]
MPREINIPAQQIYEDIYSLQELPDNQSVRVVVCVTTAEGEFIVPSQCREYMITGDMYVELNSANPPWHPGKPAGTYFNEDLWHFIDLLKQD